jgi:hypothetical protein
MTSPTLDDAIDLVLQLPSVEKLRLAERLLKTLETELATAMPLQPRPSLYGALAHLGSAPSAEDIDEMRREVWGNFPREDI